MCRLETSHIALAFEQYFGPGTTLPGKLLADVHTTTRAAMRSGLCSIADGSHQAIASLPQQMWRPRLNLPEGICLQDMHLPKTGSGCLIAPTCEQEISPVCE